MALTEDEFAWYAWRRGMISYKLWPQQLPIYNAIRELPLHSDPVVVLCARQFGKSVLGALLAIEDCLRNSEVAVMVVGPTIEQTTAIVNQSMQVISRDAPPGLIRPSKAESKWYVDDSELIIGGFDVRMASRKRGRRLHRIYIEEIVDSKPDDYEEALSSDLGPMLTHSDDASMIFLTTLPKIPDHPFITKTIPAARLRGSFYSYTIDDNKALTPEKYQACVDRAGGRHTIAFRREYLNEIVRDPTVVVVPTFCKPEHVKKFPIPTTTKWMVCVDWGGVRDKTVALLMTHDFFEAKDLVVDELVFDPNTSTNDIVQALRRWEREYEVDRRVADVPGQISVDLSQTHQYHVSSPEKSDWQSGVNQMVARFAQNTVLVHPRCTFTTLSLESGTLSKNKNDFDRSEALGHCDALAALMYGLRCIDRLNPWPHTAVSRDNSFVWAKAPEHADIAEAVVGKSFVGGHKKFGAFK